MEIFRFERKLTHQSTPFFEASEESEREVKKHTQGHTARKRTVSAQESFCLNKILKKIPLILNSLTKRLINELEDSFHLLPPILF